MRSTVERFLIFDMDGVLVNTEAMCYRVWKNIFAELGVEINMEIYRCCIGASDNVLLESVWRNCGKDFRGRTDLLDLYDRRKLQEIAEHGVPPIPGAAETLRALQARGYRMAVASASPPSHIRLCLEKVGLLPCFEVLFSGEEVERTKPAPDVFLAAAAAMGAVPADCTVVEDSTNGTLAAKAAGMRCIGFVNPDSGDQCLDAADVLIHRFAELLDVL